MDSVTLTIDGQQVTVAKGKTVLQAAIEHGVSVPYYCYHPGIGIDGSCRVCIVKIEKMAKLQTSCSTVATDGMVISTRSDDVVAARAGVFEFLLVNHPLDCPVCDKGGECPLQDFSYQFGVDQSEAGVGQGIAPDPFHAAVQSRGQQLLDVRHRTIRVSLDRKRRSSPPPARADRDRDAAADVMARGDFESFGSACRCGHEQS